MRSFHVIAALGVAGVGALTACTPSPDRLDGVASPEGARSPANRAPSSRAAPAVPSAATSSGTTRSPATGVTSRPAPAGSPRATGVLRRTDWANVTLRSLNWMALGDLRFRDGAASSDANNCTMLPGNGSPAYGEFLTEEPAGRPPTEDALILIDCGSDNRDQALVMVQLGADGRARNAAGFIEADTPAGPDRRMTFLTYRIDKGLIVTTVRTTDGGDETRRYRFAGGGRWVRA